MFSNCFEDRLAAWRLFRVGLETSAEPLDDVIQMYATAPLMSIHTDPWDQSTWPQPWQLVDDNQYCCFRIVLGYCYSLQLTDMFKACRFEIHIAMDYKSSQMYYLLFVDDSVLGYQTNAVITTSQLPATLVSQRIYVMPPLH